MIHGSRLLLMLARLTRLGWTTPPGPHLARLTLKQRREDAERIEAFGRPLAALEKLRVRGRRERHQQSANHRHAGDRDGDAGEQAPRMVCFRSHRAGQSTGQTAVLGRLAPSARSNPLVKVPWFFVQVNLAILAAWIRFLRGERIVHWTPSRR